MRGPYNGQSQEDSVYQQATDCSIDGSSLCMTAFEFGTNSAAALEADIAHLYT